ncbi:hypothetical protein CEXT_28611 [Caerostris extrusa]|uniref:Uncharacterized protein n=1 Tax=Caerostris extrusa TaxID=172846 RepID=A0AAV4TZV3_CAEEX|nr:hypothetical protein CEXT_28611 [Caerostris extrusa]
MASFRPRIILEDHPAVLITDTTSAIRNATHLTNSRNCKDLSLISCYVRQKRVDTESAYLGWALRPTQGKRAQ